MNYLRLAAATVEENVKTILQNPFKNIPSIEDAIKISKKHDIALHPRYIYYWNELSSTELITFLNYVKKIKIKEESNEMKYSFVPSDEKIKRYFEKLAIEHIVKVIPIEKVKSDTQANILVMNKLNSQMLLVNLGLNTTEYDLEKIKIQIDKIIEVASENLSLKPCSILSKCSEIEIRDKGGTYIGARMGRPEKAKMRKLDGSPQGLFPIGEGKIVKNKEFGSGEEKEELIQNRLRNILEAYHNGEVNAQFCVNYCDNCNKETIYRVCEVCGNKTEEKYFERYTGREVRKGTEKAVRYKNLDLKLDTYIEDVRKIIGEVELPKLVKGIRGTSNKHHIAEHLVKAFLRARNGIFVNKDGTVRYDMIEMGITHFKAKEIGTSVKRLRELGYETDWEGNPLENEDQIIEIYPQDVILPDCVESGDELASDYVIRTANFIDDLLEKLYKLPRFYNFKTKEDTIGHLLIGLAPHTSAGIIGRIIGYSKTQGCFSHPVWHAAQRRNLDGDENGIMLLLDGFINFSRDYLPDRRGARTMDTSLVLTSHLYLDQIDDEVHGMDIVDHYPLEFYRGAKEYKSPKDIKVEKLGKRIDKEEMDEKYLNYKFTHNTDNMNNTIMCSSYKSVPSMQEKMDLQLGIGVKIRAVNEHQVGTFIIDKHFMKDIKGNLRKFGMQTFRCTNCNTIYRRPPLNGKCVHCRKASINFTIHEGSIKKYLNPSFDIVKKYKVDPYIAETLELANLRIEGVFGKELEQQKSLQQFFK